MGIISNIFGYPLGWIMYFIYSFIPNYGIAIVIFTLITKFLLFPISVKQQKSQAAMAIFSPKLENLKKQYAKNPQKLQEEQMKLYSEEGINPMASCLPLLIQLPILYGIFDVVYRPISHILHFDKATVTQATEIAKTVLGSEKSFNTRPELYILKAIKEKPELFSGMPDLVEKVNGFHNNVFGVIDLGQVPTFSPETWNASSVGLIAIAFASGIIQLIMTIYMQNRNKKMNPGAATMPGMNAMLYFMPVFSVWISMTSPAGLGFYWAISSLFSLVQSVILYRIYTPEYVAVLVAKDKAKNKKKKKKGGRPSMMERYQQMVADQQGGGAVSSDTTVKLKKENDEPLTEEAKISKTKQKELESKIISEARKRQAEKYGEEYNESDE